MSPRRNIPAKETTYAGVQFRSRLEARWACTFTNLGWSWQYEPPMETPGWLPDFVLGFYEPVLVEAKPCLTSSQLLAEAAKVKYGGWKYEVLMLGASPKIMLDENSLGCPGDTRFGLLLTGWQGEPGDLRLYDQEDGAVAFRCDECECPSYTADLCSWHCRRCGHRQKPYVQDSRHQAAWDTAGNLMRNKIGFS